MKRLGRQSLLCAIVALACALSTTVGAAPASSQSPTTTIATLGPVIHLAPPFLTETITKSKSATASADKATGHFGTHVSLSNQLFSPSESAVVRFTTVWIAEFSGTAVFTATMHMHGKLTASASTPKPSPYAVDMASATSTVTGSVHVSGGGVDKTQNATLETARAQCEGISLVNACAQTKDLTLDKVSKPVHLIVAVQQGQPLTVETELAVEVRAFASGGNASAHGCLVGAQTTCAKLTAPPHSGVAKLEVRQQT